MEYFLGVMIAATFGLIVVAVIVTPIYYYENLGNRGMNWYVITETVFCLFSHLRLLSRLLLMDFYLRPMRTCAKYGV